MTQNLIAIRFAAVLLSTISSIASCQVEGPGKTINDFNTALKVKDTGSMVRLLTNEPDYVGRTYLKEQRKRLGISEPGDSPMPVKPGVLASGGYGTKYEGEELILRVVPLDLFFKQNRTITKIVGIRENGKEAFARVELEGSNDEKGEKYAALLYDVLLFREDDGWRIFRLNLRNKGDEEYNDTYFFYANPSYK